MNSFVEALADILGGNKHITHSLRRKSWAKTFDDKFDLFIKTIELSSGHVSGEMYQDGHFSHKWEAYTEELPGDDWYVHEVYKGADLCRL